MKSDVQAQDRVSHPVYGSGTVAGVHDGVTVVSFDQDGTYAYRIVNPARLSVRAEA